MLTNSQLESRLIALETAVNQILTAVNSTLATKSVMNGLSAIHEKQVSDLTARVTSLESAVQVLQEAIVLAQ